VKLFHVISILLLLATPDAFADFGFNQLPCSYVLSTSSISEEALQGILDEGLKQLDKKTFTATFGGRERKVWFQV